MRWAYPAVESFLGNQGQAYAHVNRKIIPLPRCVFQNLCEPVASLSTGQFCLSVVPLETLFPVTVRGWGGGGETRGGGVRVPSASPTLLLSVVRSAPSWGWGPRPMLPRIPPGPSPAARGSGILAKSRRAGSPCLSRGTAAAGARRAPPARRRLEAGGPVCKCPAGRPPPARIKARGGASRRSRCFSGAGRALRPGASPLLAREARGLPVRTRGGSGARGGVGRGRASQPGAQLEPPASLWSPLCLGPGAPSRAEPCPWEPGNRRLCCALLGAGQVASPQVLRRASLSPGHQRSSAKGAAFGVRSVGRG